MKTAYLLIDLSSLIIYIEDAKGVYQPTINLQIINLIQQMCSNNPKKEIEFRIVLFGSKNHLKCHQSTSELFFFKKGGLESGLPFCQIHALVKKCLISFNIQQIRLANSLFIIGKKDNPSLRLDFGNLKRAVNEGTLSPKNVLMISPDKALLENLQPDEISTIRTYQTGEINKSGLEKLNSALLSTENPSIHWFVDIDETLLKRHDTKLQKKTILNKSLIEIIKTTSIHDSALRISALTARKNPYAEFKKIVLKLMNIVQENEIKDELLISTLSCEDTFHTSDTIMIACKIIDRLESLISNTKSLETQLIPIKKELNHFVDSAVSMSLLLVESVKNVILTESGLNLQIEPFSYVDTTVTPKANIIQTIKSNKSDLSEAKKEIIIFSDDNRKEIKAAAEIKLASEKCHSIILPIHSDGDLEDQYEAKMLSFTANLMLSEVKAPTKKHTIESTNPPSVFWKKSRNGEEDSRTPFAQNPHNNSPTHK